MKYAIIFICLFLLSCSTDDVAGKIKELDAHWRELNIQYSIKLDSVDENLKLLHDIKFIDRRERLNDSMKIIAVKIDILKERLK